MTSAKPARRMHSTSMSSHTTESSSLSNQNNNENETVLMAKKFSSISLAEREERQQALDRLEILKTVSERISREDRRIVSPGSVCRRIYSNR